MSKRLEIAKQVIKDYAYYAMYGIYFNRNCVGDEMDTIYDGNGLTIDICYYYGYFEVFGLSDEEERTISDYYYTIKQRIRDAIESEDNEN